MGREGAQTDRSRAVLWMERILPIGVLSVALASAPIMVFSSEGLPRLRSVEKELAAVERENVALRREIETLRSRVRTLREQPAAVERLARDELGLVRQSEVVFQFPE
jgi:cell division protein FtsB